MEPNCFALLHGRFSELRLPKHQRVRELTQSLSTMHSRGTCAGAGFTIEEHNIIRGLASAVMGLLGQRFPVHTDSTAVSDCFVKLGTPEKPRDKYGLTAQWIARRIRGSPEGRTPGLLVHKEGRNKSVNAP